MKTHHCLAGSTLVNTTAGMRRIDALVGLEDVTVKTWNPATKQRENVLATNIRKTQTNTALVRVTFDNRSFIHCTADHKFRAFVESVEVEKTAAELASMVHTEVRGIGSRPRVVEVQPVLGEHPTYSMDVGEVGWFFTNNVLSKSAE